jgi:hypothetical protein
MNEERKTKELLANVTSRLTSAAAALPCQDSKRLKYLLYRAAVFATKIEQQMHTELQALRVSFIDRYTT